jgi:hypothetical protein
MSAKAGRSDAELRGEIIPKKGTIEFIRKKLEVLTVPKLEGIARFLKVFGLSKAGKNKVIEKLIPAISKFDRLPDTTLEDPLAIVFDKTDHLENMTEEDIKQFPWLLMKIGLMQKSLLIDIIRRLGPAGRTFLFSQCRALRRYRSDFPIDMRVSLYSKEIRRVITNILPEGLRCRNIFKGDNDKYVYAFTSNYIEWHLSKQSKFTLMSLDTLNVITLSLMKKGTAFEEIEEIVMDRCPNLNYWPQDEVTDTPPKDEEMAVVTKPKAATIVPRVGFPIDQRLTTFRY